MILYFTDQLFGLNDSCSFLFQGLTDLLLQGTQFTHFCAKHMMAGTPLGEAFKWSSNDGRKKPSVQDVIIKINMTMKIRLLS